MKYRNPNKVSDLNLAHDIVIFLGAESYSVSDHSDEVTFIDKVRKWEILNVCYEVNHDVENEEWTKSYLPKLVLLLLFLEELLLSKTRETLAALSAWFSALLARTNGGEEEEEGKEGALVVVEIEDEEEALDDDEEEPFVQAALDSSPKGFPDTGFRSTAVSANTGRADERAACSLWLAPCVRSLCCPNQTAGSLDLLGGSSPFLSPSLLSALTPLVSDIILGFPETSARFPTSVPEITTACSSASI